MLSFLATRSGVKGNGDTLDFHLAHTKSSLTLFHCIANEQSVFITILETFNITKEEFFPDDFKHNVVGTRALLGTDAA